MGYDIIPKIEDYIKIADPNKKVSNHGGIVAYLHKSIASHIFNIKYGSCYTSFRLDFIPGYIFIGAYIQPASSNYFEPSMFCELASLIMSSREKKLIPIMGGDLNCRFGNMTHAFREQNLAYDENADNSTNSHGLTYGIDMCNSCNVFPINHLKVGNCSFTGDYTYYKADKKSQIDFIFTDSAGVKSILYFAIPNDNWHLSDHRPLYLEIKAAESINSSMLLRRAKDLNYVFDPQHTKPIRHLSNYNKIIFQEYLTGSFPSLERDVLKELRKENLNGAICKIEEYTTKAYRISKSKRGPTNTACKKMDDANKKFNNLRSCLNGDTDEDKDELLRLYQESRNLLSKEIYVTEQNQWSQLLSNRNSKSIWAKIDWNGNVRKQTSNAPIFEDLTSHFEDLYKPNVNDFKKINELTTDVYVESLDKPIDKEELDTAMNEMKKSGYDHRIEMFKIIYSIMSPLLLILYNIMFYISYPAILTVSLLNAIPKKGNLSLPVNFRGIQMLPGMGVLYDRIINNRLKSWIIDKIRDVQSAFQKGKSATHQIFAIRLLVEISKLHNTTIYIGMFDLEKAFDKVSRYKMLTKLISLGIGNVMLQALKRIYTNTYCILCYGQEFSRKFQTFTGIRQGAASSVLLFICFINDLVQYLEERCQPEPILESLHCLLHADDTAILSTNRELFTMKCNHMLDYFSENTLSLNLSKSGYLIINAKEEDDKCCLQLKNGLLEYKSELTYLGVIITDSGKLANDIESYISSKRSDVTIKYGNFCRKNFLAPLDVKLDVLNTCVAASITYASETWGISPKSVEKIYRQGIKCALSVRSCVNNEIVYLESGEWPLEIRVKRQQLNFWKKIQKIANEDANNYIAKLVNLGENTSYLKYYKNLNDTYIDPVSCTNTLTRYFKEHYSSKIQEAARLDLNSKLGTYLSVNPALSKPSYENVFEFQRVLITRYRTGSHNLRIEKDRRIPNSLREERLCCCGTGIQTLRHVLLECPLLQNVREKYGISDVENGVMNDAFLIEMECILGIKR